MKNFTTKLSTLVLCAFVMSSSVFAGGKTNIHITAPDGTKVEDIYSDYNKNGSDFNLNSIDPDNDYKIYISKNKMGGSDFKKVRPKRDFRGYAAWNWIFDKDYNETREALDNNGTVLCREVNGKVQPGATSNHDSDKTCTRQHS